MKSENVAPEKLSTINVSIDDWKSIRNDLPFVRGSYGEMIRRLSNSSGVNQIKLYEALEELFHYVYEQTYYAGTSYTGNPAIEDNLETVCNRINDNVAFWYDYYNVGLEIIEDQNMCPPLYPYQQDAFNAADETKSGQIIMPVGSGKTWVQADVINEKVASESGGKVIVLLTPRITLNTQQVEEYFVRLMAHNNKPYRFMCNHSSTMKSDFLENIAHRKNISRPDYDFVSTTDPSEIREEYEHAMSNNENLVIVSTYHSANRIAEAIEKVDFVTCDEAHYVASNQFYVDADETGMNNVQIQNVFDCPYHYYTATPRTRRDGKGMNNEELFGEVFHEVSPKQLIDEGYIVEPMLFGVGAQDDPNRDSYKSDIAALTDIWNRHFEDTEYTSKLLVQAKSRRQIESMGEYVTQNNEKFDGSPSVYRISTTSYGENDWGPYIDNESVTKDEWIERVREEDGNAIIIHYDMLSEGLDVPGISGTTFFRSVGSTENPNDNRGTVKLVQILGRAMRILSEDRSKQNFEDYTKKKAYVYIPNIQDHEQLKKENLINTLVYIMNDIHDGNIPNEQLIEWGDTTHSGVGGTPSDIDIDNIQDLIGIQYYNLMETNRMSEVDKMEPFSF